MTVPLIFTKPNGGTKPANGWPVVIFQHGITANRTSVVAIADTLAQAGYASIAIDMPLHGIADSSSTSAALFGISDAEVSGIEERHFNLDLVAQDANGSITASGPDSVVDSSGRHFINLSSLLTTRDNLRQAVSDLMHLKAGLASFNGLGSSVIDASKVSFIGHSLGAMVGGVYANFATDLESAVFANGGTQAAYLLAGSPVFGPEIASGLAAQGVAPGSADFSQFLIAAQTVIDTTDPLNHVAQLSVPSAVFEVVGDGSSSYPSDQVVPNSVTGAPLAGTDPWRALQALPTISASGATTGKAALLFTQGGHSSLLDPAESLLVTQTMQEAAASFTATQGTAIQVSDSTTLQ